MNKSNSKIKIINSINKSYKSNWIFLFVILFFTLITIVQFLYNYFSKDIIFENNEFLFLILIWIGSIFSMSSIIMSARLNRSFFLFGVFALIIWTTRSFIAGLFLDMIRLIILFIPGVIQYFRWNKEKTTKDKIKVKRLHTWKIITIIFIAIIVGVSIGLGFSYINESSIFYDKVPYMDGLNFSFGLISSLIISFGFLEGWILLIASSFFLIMTYIMLSINFDQAISITGIISTTFFALINFTTGISWLHDYYLDNNTFRYINN